MEPIHVLLEKWPYDRGPGGWVALRSNRLKHWTVSTIHAIYEAPDGIKRGPDPWGKPIKPDMLRAYLVDLDGGTDAMRLPDYERVLLHRIPRKPDWWIKDVTEEYLAEREKYRKA